MTAKLLPRLELFTDFPRYNIAGDDTEAVAASIEHIDRKGITAFLAAVPTYFPSERNAALLAGWCGAYGIPLSLWNLTIAFRDLTEDGQLEQAPPPEPAPPPDRGIVRIENLAAEYVSDADERAALEKVKDDPLLSDHARKLRDAKLRLLAGRQRREFSDLPPRANRHYPEGGDPKIQI